MKDRILKLCKRLDKFSFEEIVGIAEDVDESVMELLLQTFVADNYLKCEGDNYTYIKRSKTRKAKSISNLRQIILFTKIKIIDFHEFVPC